MDNVQAFIQFLDEKFQPFTTGFPPHYTVLACFAVGFLSSFLGLFLVPKLTWIAFFAICVLIVAASANLKRP